MDDPAVPVSPIITPPTPPVEPVTPPPPVPETPILKPHKKFPVKAAGIGMFALLVLGGGVFGYNLMQQKQSVDSQAIVRWRDMDGDGDLEQDPAWSQDDPNSYGSREWEENQCLAQGGGADCSTEERDLPAGTTVADQEKNNCYGCHNGSWLVWDGGGCHTAGTCGSDIAGQDTPDPNIENSTDKDSCEATGNKWFSQEMGGCTDYKGNLAPGFCGAPNDTCTDVLLAHGYKVAYGGVCNNLVNDPGGAPTTYYCENEFNSSGCQQKDPLPAGVGWNGEQVTGSFCGIIQLDIPGSDWCSVLDTSGCDTPPGETPPGSPTPSPSPTASLVCQTLTSSIAAPKIGDQLLFTCAGSTTPAGATTLAYEYRYKIGSGSWQAITTNAQGKGSLTVAATGAYEVQCRACGNLSSQTVCSPDWAAATP